MQVNKSESKYFATAARMDKAFLALLEKEDFEYITVKEICDAAGVNRSTFYLHYETVGDLLAESVQYMYDGFISHMKDNEAGLLPDIKNCNVNELYFITPRYLEPYLNYVLENRGFFKTAMKNAATLRFDKAYEAMFSYIFVPILERFHVPADEREYMMTFYVHGLMAIVGEWLENDCTDSVECVISVMRRCVMHAIADE